MFHFKKNEIPFWFPNQCVHPIIETISFTILFCGPFDAEQHRPYQLFTLSLICCNMLSWLVVSFALKVPIQPQSYSLPYDITSNDHFLICLGLVFDPFYFFFLIYNFNKPLQGGYLRWWSQKNLIFLGWLKRYARGWPRPSNMPTSATPWGRILIWCRCRAPHCETGFGWSMWEWVKTYLAIRYLRVDCWLMMIGINYHMVDHGSSYWLID